MKLLKLGFLLMLLSTFVFVSCEDDDNDGQDTPMPPATLTIAEIVTNDANFSTLLTALQRTGLDAVLAGSGNFTVFAPNNDAFQGIDVNAIDVNVLRGILLYHVLGSEVPSSAIPSGETYVSTLDTNGRGNNLSLFVNNNSGAITLNGDAMVMMPDVNATNGVVHVIDKVLSQQSIVDFATKNSSFTSLVTSLGAASGDLVNVLSGAGPFTVFAPTNDGFDAISSIAANLTADKLRDLLLYHVVGAEAVSGDLSDGQVINTQFAGNDVTVNINGGTVTITDGAGVARTVAVTDVVGTNGVIHVLTEVLLPNDNFNSIADIVVNNPDFSLLLQALQRTGLDATLAGSGTFTVFAPNNEAFANFGITSNDIAAADVDDLRTLLLYHVLGTEIPSSAVPSGLTYVSSLAENERGNNMSILVSNSGSIIDLNDDDAEVISPDVDATNGIIHVIDWVIEPIDITEFAINDSRLDSLVAVLGRASGDLVTVLEGDGPFTVFAPTNSAFEAIAGTVATLDADALSQILLYHVLDIEAVSSGLTPGLMVDPLRTGNDMLTVNINGDDVSITDGSGGTRNVIIRDVVGINGVVHVIDGVLLP